MEFRMGDKVQNPSDFVSFFLFLSLELFNIFRQNFLLEGILHEDNREFYKFPENQYYKTLESDTKGRSY
jgi:hypothetical protein